MDTNLVREGLWVHKTEEKSRAIEVVGVDYHRKQVRLSDEKVWTFDELLKNYFLPSFGAQPTRNLLGDLDLENDVSKFDVIEDNEKIDGKKEIKLTIEETPPIIDLKIGKGSDELELDERLNGAQIHNLNSGDKLITHEEKMISDALNISLKNDKNVVVDRENISVNFGYDILKITRMAKMFNIDNETVCNVLLSNPKTIDSLKSLLSSIIVSISEEL